MPTYEYLCESCGGEFEAFQSMKDSPLTGCQLCGVEGQVRRKIGRGAGIIFKGSGFYETDFKDRKGRKSDSEGSVETSSSKSGDRGGGASAGAGDAKSGKKPAESASSSTGKTGSS